MRRFLMLVFATVAVCTMALTTISWALKPESVGPTTAIGKSWMIGTYPLLKDR